ncbi:MAG: zinc metalloprotease, partial [Chitinophagaceae bacterium]
MKKLLFLVYFSFPILAFSQISRVKNARNCATYEVLENMRKLNPNMETDQQFEQWLSARKQQMRTTNTQAVVTLPIVFHIIHKGEALGVGTNISQTLIQQQVLQLNKDYANLSNSPYASSANTNIQFALAQKDPNGNILAEPGIDRFNYTSKGLTAPPYTVGSANPLDNQLTNSVKPATIWDPTRYINIWVLEMESGILGIATFPSSSGLADLTGGDNNSTAGVAIGPSTVGSIFLPSSCDQYTKGKTLTHELGHFFGLRHIWGDAACGNDFCGDTPTHQGQNGGVPTHPKANSCGTSDEMFENYMDYTDDVILNTFTADQVARMQAVLTNSPRRNTLATSNVGLVAVTGTNRVAFYDCIGSVTVNETGNTGTYPRYRDYTFTLNVEDKATGNATVTINGGGTATAGFHYQLLTPSINFVNGDNYKPVTVRVFDNAQVDGARTISLSYSISGTGVAAGPSSQTMSITILDDDAVTVSNNIITLLSQNWDGSIVGWNTLSTSGMPNLWKISNGGDAGGSGNMAYISNSTTVPYANTYTNTVAGLAVLRSPLINASGVKDLVLSFKYKVRGEVASGTAYDYGMMTYATPAAPNSFPDVPATGAGPYANRSATVSGTPAINLPNAVFSNTSFYLGWLWENDDAGGTNPAFNVDDIELKGTGTQVETAVSNSYGYDVRSGAGINNFRSTNDKAIARLTNLSENVTGITASVIAAGSAQASITTSTGTFSRTEKVFQITPAVANTTASYRVTLYFTSAELAVWGGNKLLLKVLKVKDGASLTGPINSGNAIAVTPVSATEDAAAGVIAYTADFTGGFSQF